MLGSHQIHSLLSCGVPCHRGADIPDRTLATHSASSERWRAFRVLRVVKEMWGAPRNPAPRNHFLVWIVKPSGCHCTDGHLTSRVVTEDQQISWCAELPEEHFLSLWHVLAIFYPSLKYYTILYCTTLCYTLLYYAILYSTMLYSTILYYNILYYTILYYAMLYYTILYYTILYYTILALFYPSLK